MLKKIITLILTIFFLSCSDSSNSVNSEPNTPDNDLGITSVPTELGNKYTENFVKYTKVTAPNGKAIHIVAQNQLTDFQIIKARNVLEHYLKNLPESLYGKDKNAVANSMADNNAILLLGNGRDSEDNPINSLNIMGQPLFHDELVAEGSEWYMNCNFEHRDASYEEILHLVHDYGIGIDDVNNNGTGTPGALVDTYQKKIRTATTYAMENKLWPTEASGEMTNEWINELSQENSLTQEYMASVIDSYYGLWGSWTEGDGGMWGIYTAKTRDEIEEKDPKGYELVKDFFADYITYNARLDSSLTGTFSLKYNTELPYTNNSRYLKDITLTGNNNVDVVVNKMNNDITGNDGVNIIIFSGNKSEYTIEKKSGKTIVTDKTDNRDGKNYLNKVEKLKFTDTVIDI